MAPELGWPEVGALGRLYAAAFPAEDLSGLLAGLRSIGAVSVRAGAEGAPAGHAVLTLCGTRGQDARAALLGPVAVHPDHQRRGLGGALVRAALAAAEGARQVNVLGDPAFYGRFGFVADPDLATPCPIPEEWAGAWQRLVLGAEGPLRGRLAVPPPWRDPALWMP